MSAILFPVFATAREKARQSTCASNLKQLGLAAVQYCQDFDEMAIPSRLGSANVVTWNWCCAIYPYVKSTAVFTCPSQAVAGSVLDYTYNWNVGFDSGLTGYPCRSISAIPYPSSTVMFADAIGGTTITSITKVTDDCLIFNVNASTTGTSTGNGTETARYLVGNGNQTGYPVCDAGVASTRHSGGANYAFVDGHIKWRGPSIIGQGFAQSLNCSAQGYTTQGPPSDGVNYFPDDNALGTTAIYY
ncbi:MAG: DUF1559 domain-containing protein [Capsulimonadaceae bacterium]|nr:DUF1559 domain-containing protein [Capsulimonadaceae bacterium]